MNTELRHAVWLAVATSFVASLVAAGSKWASGYVSIHQLVASQYFVGFCLYLPLLLRGGKAAVQTGRIGLHLLRGLAGLGAFYAYYAAIQHVPLLEATLLRNSAPLLVPLIALWFLQVRIPASRWWPLLVGFVGVLVILRPLPSILSAWHLVGFAAAWLMAASMITTRLLTYTESNQVVLFYYFSVALLVSTPLALITWQVAPWWVYGVLLLLGLGLALALWLYTLAYRAAKPSVLAPVSYMSVVFAGFWGWLFWRETPDLFAGVGTLLVVVSAVMILWQDQQAPSQPLPAAPRPPA